MWRLPRRQANSGAGHDLQVDMLWRLWGQGGKDALLVRQACMDQAQVMAMDKAGCRLFQAVFKADEHGDAQMALASKLAGSVPSACKSPYGNYVIQQIVELCPSASFVAEEIQGHACELAVNQYGCRILCKLLKFRPKEGPAAHICDTLVGELMECCTSLCSHKYAHHVIATIQEHGSDAQRNGVLEQLLVSPAELAVKRYGSYIIEAALKRHLRDEKRSANLERSANTLAAKLLAGDPSPLPQLACDQFGSYVVRALLEMGGEHAADTRRSLQSDVSLLSKLESSTKNGHLILKKLKSSDE